MGLSNAASEITFNIPTFLCVYAGRDITSSIERSNLMRIIIEVVDDVCAYLC